MSQNAGQMEGSLEKWGNWAELGKLVEVEQAEPVGKAQEQLAARVDQVQAPKVAVGEPLVEWENGACLPSQELHFRVHLLEPHIPCLLGRKST